jgi:hypothetical protein
LCLVNELSNTIDLEQTLTKAEALFRRFQRTAEAIDRKTAALPEPSTLRQRKIGSNTEAVKDNTNSRATPALLKSPESATEDTSAIVAASGSEASTATFATAKSSTTTPAQDTEDSTGKSKATPVVKGKSRQWPTQAERMAAAPEPMKTISPELRALLSREVIKLDKKEVQKHGGGVGK